MIEIPLTQGKVALVDDEDAELAAFNWYAHKSCRRWYAARGAREKATTLHREVWLRMRPGAPPPPQIDHVSGDGLDCRRENLRAASTAQNQYNARVVSDNTSGYKGVAWHRRDRRWRAQIQANGKLRHLGNFHSAEDAARAYDDAARSAHGEFACVNFPGRGERAARQEA
jgi:hypothetical protein